MSGEHASTGFILSPSDRFSALQLLESSRAHERLLAARFFFKYANPGDVDALSHALTKENVSWVRNALSATLKRLRGGQNAPTTIVELTDSTLDQQMTELYANALQETTALLLHEVEPLLGKARVYAGREVPNFEQSRVKEQLDVMDALLSAIFELRRASSPAKLQELDLSSLVRQVKEQQVEKREVDVQLAGPSPFSVLADRGRLWMAIMNGLRNAIESTEATEPQNRRPIIINWNQTERDYWLSIIDHGIGLKSGLANAFEVGTSSKKNHLGMGLPVVRQAVQSMQGEAHLYPRDDMGVRFEIRWPRFKTSTT